MHKTLKFLAILLLCVFTSPSFAGDGGGDRYPCTELADGYCVISGVTCDRDQQCTQYDGTCDILSQGCKVLCEDICECTPEDAYCDPGDPWEDISSGYQKKECFGVNEFCQKTTETQYRCAAGYYGQSDDGVTGCAPCPSWNGCPATSNAGATTIVECYVPNYNSETGQCSVPFEDETGSGNMWFSAPNQPGCYHEPVDP